MASRPNEPVLLVEDNVETRHALKMVLEINGYHVAVAGDGSEALDYLRAGNRVCLIILDLGLPVMDGWAFMQRLKEDEALTTVPVIAFSGINGSQLPGALATIHKSAVDPHAFMRMIESACR